MSQIFVPEDAPFNNEQRAWLNDFFAKTLSGQAAVPSGAAEVPVTILWGSQTGNSEGIANKLVKALKGCKVEVFDMDQYDRSRLPQEKNLLVVTSTYGDGEAPDNAQALHEYVMSDNAARMGNVNFAVFALGDSEYPDFCVCGWDLFSGSGISRCCRSRR